MRAFRRQRFAVTASLVAATLTFACPSTALELRVAAWNLEHLADSNAEGCVGREDADYSALAERIHALGADVVAFQEVENAAAGRRVFDEERWSVEVSTRPSTGSGPPCGGRPSARLGHLATGIAVRAGLEYTRNADFSVIAGGNRFMRWGTDVTVTRGGEDLRVLSVHLKSGCWGVGQDDNASSAATCATLREQMETLAEWIADRREEGTPFVIAGDFNRRLAVPGDWGWVLLSENNLASPSSPLGASRAATRGIRSTSITCSSTRTQAPPWHLGRSKRSSAVRRTPTTARCPRAFASRHPMRRSPCPSWSPLPAPPRGASCVW